MAPPDWAHSALVWSSGGYDCARDELWNAGNRRRQSSSGNDAICFVLSVRFRQGVAPYSAAGNRAPSRMDDSCVFHRFSGRNDTANRWSLFRHSPVYRTHTLRVLRYRVLDWFCSTPHRCGNLDSMDSTTGIQNIFVIFEKGNLPWRCLITSSSHRMTEKRRRSYWRTSSASSPVNHFAYSRLSTSTRPSPSTLWTATNSMCTTIVSRSLTKSLKRSSQDCGTRRFLIAAARTVRWT